jgi:Tol biopolymer transport system component
MLDGRADIYALGCVVYEMLAGAPPLTGATPQQIQARRLAETPTSLTLLRDTVPPLVDQAVGRALARVPADRFRTAGEFGEALGSAVLGATPSTTGGIVTLPAHGAERMRTRRRLIAVAGAVGVLALAGWLLGGRLWGNGESSQSALPGLVERQLTTSGRVVEASLSPSAELVAFCEMEESGFRLKLVETSIRSEATDLAIFEICRMPHWMPDGQSVVVFGQAKGERGIYRVSRQGGAPTRIGPPALPFAISPDGTSLVVPTASRRGLEILPIADAAGAIVGATIDVPGDYLSLSDVDWSHDGEQLAVATHGTGASAIRLVDLTESASERILVEETGRVLGLQWIAGSDALLYLRESVNGTDLMRVEVPDGGSSDAIGERVRSVGMSTSLGIASDAQSLVVTRHQPRSTFVTASPEPEGDSSTSIVRPQQEVEQRVISMTLSDDGTWVHYVGAGASGRDLYRLPTSGGQPERITHSGDVRFADWSPDGRFLAYVAPLGDEMRLWIISRHGGSPGIVQDVVVGRAGMVSWEPDRLYYHHPDGQNFGVLSGLEVLSAAGWTRLLDQPDEPFVSRRRIRATSETPLVSNDTLGTMYGPHSSPTTPDVVVEWNRAPSGGSWLISRVNGSQTRLSGRGWPLGWTSDGLQLYWQIDREVFRRPLDGELSLIFTLPERLYGCGRDHGADVERFLCFEREDNANVWLLEGFDL